MPEHNPARRTHRLAALDAAARAQGEHRDRPAPDDDRERIAAEIVAAGDDAPGPEVAVSKSGKHSYAIGDSEPVVFHRERDSEDGHVATVRAVPAPEQQAE